MGHGELGIANCELGKRELGKRELGKREFVNFIHFIHLSPMP